MEYRKLIVLIMIILVLIISAGCSKQEKVEEEPYLKYIITTYSGGKVIDIFEVYSDMGWQFNKSFIAIWNSPLEEVLLFYSTLDYNVEVLIK